MTFNNELRSTITLRANKFKLHLTESEVMMKSILISLNIRFMTQKIFLPYIVDYYIPKPYKIVIEIDGDIHKNRREYDDKRTKWILDRHRYFRLIRFSNEEVLETPQLVRERLIKLLNG